MAVCRSTVHYTSAHCLSLSLEQEASRAAASDVPAVLDLATESFSLLTDSRVGLLTVARGAESHSTHASRVALVDTSLSTWVCTQAVPERSHLYGFLRK